MVDDRHEHDFKNRIVENVSIFCGEKLQKNKRKKETPQKTQNKQEKTKIYIY